MKKNEKKMSVKPGPQRKDYLKKEEHTYKTNGLLTSSSPTTKTTSKEVG